MTIPTLKISRLSQTELQQLASITREVHRQTGQRFSLLDPQLIIKLKDAAPALQNEDINRRLCLLAKRLLCETPTPEEAVQVDCYRKYGVKVKYYDQSAA